MANLTLSVDRELLRRARIRALERGTSVNAIVRAYLERFAASGETESAVEGFLRRAEAGRAGSGPDGRTWTREELYDR